MSGAKIIYTIAAILVILNSQVECRETRLSPDCNAKVISDGKVVCTCNNQDCDDLKFDWPTREGQAILVETSRAGKRFRQSNIETDHGRDGYKATGSKVDVEISIKLSESYQTIYGFGGAFTDSASQNIFSLSRNMSKRLIESYFGENGLLYNFGRVPIAGSDFSDRPYTYDDVSDDYDLAHWSLASEDIDLKIPLIKQAKELCEKREEQLKLFASPWSPPAWMKTSNSLVRGFLIDNDRVYRSYANYLIKFYKAYKEHGIEFWGATIQNEPETAIFDPSYFFNSLEMNSTQTIKFVSKYLGPSLEQNGMGADKFKLMIGDDSLGFIENLIVKSLEEPDVNKYISGLAIHWYRSGVPVPYDNLTRLYELTKDKVEFILMTEACAATAQYSRKVDIGSWVRGDAYALDIIEDLLRHSVGWVDWNLALNEEGGPNWANNFIDSPIIVNAKKDEFYKQPMYYALAHFSRLFRPGSIRVGSKVKSRLDLRSVAVRNDESGHLSVNILNRSYRDVRVTLIIDNGKRYKPKSFSLDAKSINSIVIKL